MTRLYAEAARFRTRRGGATRRRSRCVPWGAVEPLVHAPKAVQSARVSGISVVNDAVLERERAHARPLTYVRVHVRSAHGRELTGPVRCRARRYWRDRFLAFVVVFDTLALFLLRERSAEVGVESAIGR